MADRDCRNNDRQCHAGELEWFDEEIEDPNWFDGVELPNINGMKFFTSDRPLRGLEQDG